MSLVIRERSLGAAGFAWVPTGPGPFPAVLVIHDSHPWCGGWASRDAAVLAAHGMAALAVRDDIALAASALRAAPFVNGRLGVFAVGAGAARMAAALADIRPDAVALHAPSPLADDALDGLVVPLFLSHGTADAIMPVETSQRLQARLPQVEVHYYDGLDHGLNDEDAANRNTERWVNFLRRHLDSVERAR